LAENAGKMASLRLVLIRRFDSGEIDYFLINISRNNYLNCKSKQLAYMCNFCMNKDQWVLKLCVTYCSLSIDQHFFYSGHMSIVATFLSLYWKEK